ncbi:MAG: hypothetical protein PVH61_21430 [Candidatus Aminicenantes bacterium]
MKKRFFLKDRGPGRGFFMISCLTLLVTPFLIPAHSGLTAQEKKHEPIVEKVTVTNVEVPVRVLHKGKPVIDLTRDDFTIYENKKKVTINGFFLKRKKVNITGTTKVIGESKPLPPRTFVLVFSITDFNQYLVKAVDHLFENILRTNDRLLVLVNNKTREFPNLENAGKIKRQLMTDLQEEARQARHRLVTYINKVETYLNMYDFRHRLIGKFGGRTPPTRVDKRWQKLVSFLDKYLLTWIDYKKNYLSPRVDRFYYFSRYLERLKGDKWVFSFYQFDLFPKIRLTSRTMNYIRDLSSMIMDSREAGAHSLGKRLHTLSNQIMAELNVSSGFPTEEVSKLFYKVDATFHSFFIKSVVKSSVGDVEYEEVASDIERTLKQITDITGGQNITSNDLVQSIETVSELEDVYYILTYAPRDPKKAGKLKIKVKNKRYKVLYDDNFRADYINEYLQKLEGKIKTPEIKLKAFSFDRKILAFTVTDYLMKKIKEQDKAAVGMLKIRIRLVNRDNISLFNQEKVLTAQKSEMKISLGAFKKIKRGEYDFLIDAVDMFTGKEDNFHQKVNVR